MAAVCSAVCTVCLDAVLPFETPEARQQWADGHEKATRPDPDVADPTGHRVELFDGVPSPEAALDELRARGHVG